VHREKCEEQKNSKKSIMSNESKSTLKSMDHFNMENYMVADALSWTGAHWHLSRNPVIEAFLSSVKVSSFSSVFVPFSRLGFQAPAERVSSFEVLVN
jgi:hypothetical protein